jgi:hypothetical protein
MTTNDAFLGQLPSYISPSEYSLAYGSEVLTHPYPVMNLSIPTHPVSHQAPLSSQ